MTKYNTDHLRVFFEDRFLKWALAIAVFLFAFKLQRSIALRGLDVHHDLIMFNAAARLLNGGVPFRDFFYQYNPGSIFLHALALKTMGELVASLKIATVLSYSGIAALIFACGARGGRLYIPFLAALVWAMLSPFYMVSLIGYHTWPTVYMMCAVMAGAFFMGPALLGGHFLYSLLSGACFALAFWFKQVAAYQIIAVLLWLSFYALSNYRLSSDLKKARALFLGFAIGGAGASLPFFFYLWSHGAFGSWYEQVVTFNAKFAAQSNEGLSPIVLLRMLFPISHIFGYRSLLWAILPLALMAIAIRPDVSRNKSILSPRNEADHYLALFVFLSIAGWLEYFPLPHPFHTQMFLAPMFVVMAIWLNNNLLIAKSLPVHRLVISGCVAAAVMACLSFEVLEHVRNLNRKLAESAAIIQNQSPARGLALREDEARSFDKFYKALTAKRNPELPLVPMSVDIIAGLLPVAEQKSGVFKMGLDWTWANEIVEPGFNVLLQNEIAARHSLIYTDSIMSIPGYAPTSMLEMRSPFTSSHYLYEPTGDAAVHEPRDITVTKASTLFLRDFPLAERGVMRPQLIPNETKLLGLEGIQDVTVSQITQINVASILPEDVRETASKADIGFLESLHGDAPQKVAQNYRLTSDGSYRLKNGPLKGDEFVQVAKFLLRRGKFYSSTVLTRTISSLMELYDKRPFLVAVSDDTPTVAWARKGEIKFDDSAGSKSSELFLAVPGFLVKENEEAVLYVQLQMKDRTTRDFYLHYVVPANDCKMPYGGGDEC